MEKVTEYIGQSPVDQTTYKLPETLKASIVKAIGVGGSDEPIRTFEKDGVWYMECPVFAVNPKYVRFETKFI